MAVTRYEEVIDGLTGEVVKSTKAKIFYAKDGLQENFIQEYTKVLCILKSMSLGAAHQVLASLMEVAKFNSAEISLTTGKRERLIKDLKISRSTFDKAVKELIDKKLLMSVEGEKGEYLINPEYFWFGTQDDRNDLLSGKKKCAITITAVEPPLD